MLTIKRLKVVTLVVLTGFGAACSTVSSIRTTPSGAKLSLNGRYLGVSPMELELKDGFIPGSDSRIKVEKEGYKTLSVMLEQDLSAGYIVMDMLLYPVTLGLSLYFGVANARAHRESYSFILEPEPGTAEQGPAEQGPAERGPACECPEPNCEPLAPPPPGPSVSIKVSGEQVTIAGQPVAAEAVTGRLTKLRNEVPDLTLSLSAAPESSSHAISRVIAAARAAGFDAIGLGE